MVPCQRAGDSSVYVALQAQELVLIEVILDLKPGALFLIEQGAELIGPIGRCDAVVADNMLRLSLLIICCAMRDME